jgi:hypothetical protein
MEIVKGRQYIDDAEGGYGIREVSRVGDRTVDFKKPGPDWAPDTLPIHVFKRLFKPVVSSTLVSYNLLLEEETAFLYRVGWALSDGMWYPPACAWEIPFAHFHDQAVSKAKLFIRNGWDYSIERCFAPGHET